MGRGNKKLQGRKEGKIVQGLGFRDQGLGFRVQGYGKQSLGNRGGRGGKGQDEGERRRGRGNRSQGLVRVLGISGQGLGSRIWFRVQGLGFRAQSCLEFRLGLELLQGFAEFDPTKCVLNFGVQFLRFRVQGVGFRAQGLGVQCLGLITLYT